jgi:hypothetical protein
MFSSDSSSNAGCFIALEGRGERAGREAKQGEYVAPAAGIGREGGGGMEGQVNNGQWSRNAATAVQLPASVGTNVGEINRRRFTSTANQWHASVVDLSSVRHTWNRKSVCKLLRWMERAQEMNEANDSKNHFCLVIFIHISPFHSMQLFPVQSFFFKCDHISPKMQMHVVIISTHETSLGGGMHSFSGSAN